MDAFITPLTGGLLIGSSAVLLLFALGRVAGISGVVWGAISAQPDNAWRWLFIVGLILGPLLFHSVSGVAYPAPSSQPWWVALIGGLVVGIGVKLGSGCTSGHGVCGIGRLSLRSLVATLTFMATGIATVYITHHLMGGL
ncbi:MAG: YeeE/YedE thiosulfate transporter family protein [Halieaceae bacterium]